MRNMSSLDTDFVTILRQLSASLALACILVGPASAQDHRRESAEATESMLLVPAPAWVPEKRDPGSRIEATRQVTTGHWNASARFVWNWSSERWVATAFLTRFDSPDDSGAAMRVAKSSSGAPIQTFTDPPNIPNDPNPPTQHGTVGDTAVNTFSQGNWTYTISYVYGWRDGLMGWHVASVSAVYKEPKNPPEDPR
jgi:hypothetical protein